MKHLRNRIIAVLGLAVVIGVLALAAPVAVMSQTTPSLLSSVTATQSVEVRTGGAAKVYATMATLKTFMASGGTPGPGVFSTVTINGDGGTMPATYYFTGTPAATDQVFFIATRAMKITSISQVHSVAAGGTSTLDVTKDVTTDAPGAGTVVTTAPFNLNATANTVQAGTLAAAATITLAAGNRLSVNYNHAIQSSAGVVVTVLMQPL